MNFLVDGKISKNYNTTNAGVRYSSADVNSDFESSVFSCVDNLKSFSDTTKKALSNYDSIIILKNKKSDIPDDFSATEKKFVNYASDSYGFVSHNDKAIVIVEENHHRKDTRLEGNIIDQAADTFAHELGHVIDKELSTSAAFKNAYLRDLENIYILLDDPDTLIEGEKLRESLFYLKHYVDGVNFEDGISEEDITRTGLRENFAECFSTIVDMSPSKINKIFSTLFPNTMAQTMAFIV